MTQRKVDLVDHEDFEHELLQCSYGEDPFLPWMMIAEAAPYFEVRSLDLHVTVSQLEPGHPILFEPFIQALGAENQNPISGHEGSLSPDPFTNALRPLSSLEDIAILETRNTPC